MLWDEERNIATGFAVEISCYFLLNVVEKKTWGNVEVGKRLACYFLLNVVGLVAPFAYCYKQRGLAIFFWMLSAGIPPVINPNNILSTCYFLLNVVKLVKDEITPSWTIVLLFSFECCYPMKLWRCLNTKLVNLLFSFECCTLSSITS